MNYNTSIGGHYSMYQLLPPLLASAMPSAPTLSPAATPSWDQAAFFQAMNNFATQGNSGMDWIFYSGASSHMSNSRNMLSSCISSPFSSITLGDGSLIPIHCVGQTHLPSTTIPLLL
jgi:hypothetical protein